MLEIAGDRTRRHREMDEEDSRNKKAGSVSKVLFTVELKIL